MFDTAKMYRILNETTRQARKGEVFTGTPAMVDWAKNAGDETPAPGGVLEVFAMPSAADPMFKDSELVDLHFIQIAVDRHAAEKSRADFVALLDSWPEPAELAGGPSYLAAGGTLGDQGAAFQMFALGEALGLWSVITPERLGFSGAEANQMACMGFVMCSGYRPNAGAAA
jgi:hypothetical protein